MKLYELQKFIKSYGPFFLVVILGLYVGFELGPQFVRENFNTVTTTTPPQEIISVKKINPLIFTPQNIYQTGSGKIDVSNTRVTYLGNLEEEFRNLSEKNFPVFELVLKRNTPLDYSQTASEIAFNLGYEESNQISKGDLTDDFLWSKNNLTFNINKKTQDMYQIIPNGNLAAFKSFYTAGEFKSNSTTQDLARSMLQFSRKFNSQELSNVFYISDYFRFQGDSLVSTNMEGSEIAYTRVYQNLYGLKVVNKNYDISNSFFFIGSMRPQLVENFKNIQYPTFKISKNEYVNRMREDIFSIKPAQEAFNEISIYKNFIIAGIRIDNLPPFLTPAPFPGNLNIKSITLENFELAYYDDFDGNILNNTSIQPIYVFKGNFELENGGRGKIILYTRALENKFYNL
jgi:hypothetical protein